MTINVVALIKNIGKSYRQLVEGNLIAYKSPPKGHSGSPTVRLHMDKEGIFLAFKRDGRILNEVTLYLQQEHNTSWTFPNELPQPFEKKMIRTWAHENIGTPSRSSPPNVIMKIAFGWCDLYENNSGPLAVSYQIDYDVMDNARQITFTPTSELRW